MRRAKIFISGHRVRLLFGIAVFLLFLVPSSALAEKRVSLSAASANVEVGKTLDVAITINTDGEPINAVGFSVDFPTEVLEGLVPNRSGSVFPFWVSETATRIDCGIQGQTGFSGSGLVTTLRFKGRTAGTANIKLRNIKVLFAGTTISGFDTNDINITVLESGTAAPEPTPLEVKPKKTLTPPSTSSTSAPLPTPNAQTETAIPSPTQTFGSLAQVKGTKGSAAGEEALKAAPVVEAEASVKGLFTKNSILWTSILPTGFLLAIVIFLGIKLYFSDRKRHLHLEHLFEKQLGTLAALESKIDIVEINGAEGKEQYLKEIETAKNDIMSQTTVNGAEVEKKAA